LKVSLELVDRLLDFLRPLRLRGKLRVLRRLVPDRGERETRVFGYRVQLDLGEDIQRAIYLGAFEPRETAIVLRLLRAGMTFVDVGANIGYFTLLAASRVGARGRVFAIEPSPVAHDRLEATVLRNAIARVVTLRLALGEQPGWLDLYLPQEGSRLHSPTMVHTPGVRTISVPVRTLDDCLDEWGVEHVHFLKLDIEGYEPHVLRGARRALAAGRVHAVLCEFNDPWLRAAGSSPEHLHTMLIAAGFRDLHGTPRFRRGAVQNRFFRLQTMYPIGRPA
jgi:FkbM family methyltransferase